MRRLAERRAEDRHDPVPKVLVDVSSVPPNDIGHHREILIEQRHQLLRGKTFGDRGKAGDVRKQHRELFFFAAELDFRVAHDLIHDLGRHVLVEGRAKLPPLPTLGEVFDACRHGKGHRNRRLRESQFQPQAVALECMHRQTVIGEGQSGDHRKFQDLLLEQHEAPGCCEAQDHHRYKK